MMKKIKIKTFDKQKFLQNYEKAGYISQKQGGTADVKVYKSKNNGEYVALKTFFTDETAYKAFKNEAIILDKLSNSKNNHKNIVKIIDYGKIKLKHNTKQGYILMEYCESI